MHNQGACSTELEVTNVIGGDEVGSLTSEVSFELQEFEKCTASLLDAGML